MVQLDIEMPEYCYDCPLNHSENGRCKITGYSDCGGKRPFDCPLKEVEQKHGHWDYYGYDEISNVHIYRCSECECGNREATDYCPYCGTIMDEEERVLDNENNLS